MSRSVLQKSQQGWRWGAGLAGGALLALIIAIWLPQQAEALPGSDHYPSCRFGVTVGGDITLYDVASLNVGWYLDWHTTAAPPQPGGAEYVQLVHLEQVGQGFAFYPPTSTLYTIMDANPGAIWLIGNEQDRRIYQDDLPPEIYARAYHHLYNLIKVRDPSAQIAIGGVVQPTPLRFQYLDLVWDTYMREYGTLMPVDVWNVHSFILREISSEHPLLHQPGYENWGADIPRGAQFDSVMEGILYRYSHQDDLAIFRQRIIEFRRWMAARGQRDKPLIVTEYGVLFPEDYYDESGRLFSAERVGTFMRGTFDFFRTYTDPAIGYPADGNRLVQRWAWFSVDANPWYWGGTLFDPATHGLRPLGEDFRAYTSALSPTVDLVAARAFAEPPVILYEGVPVTATLKALVSNAGDVATTGPITVTFYDGLLGESGSSLIGSVQVITTGLHGCADYEIVETQWPGLIVGGHRFYIVVENADDSRSDNNTAEGMVLVANSRVFLPLVVKNSVR